MLTGISRGLEKEGARRVSEGLGTHTCAGAVQADDGGHSCELPPRPVAGQMPLAQSQCRWRVRVPDRPLPSPSKRSWHWSWLQKQPPARK